MKRNIVIRACIITLIPLAIFMTFMGCGKKTKTESSSAKSMAKTEAPAMAMAKTDTVVINNYAYLPDTITIAVKDTVVWINKQDVSHTVTSDQGDMLNSDLIAQGQTYTYVFDDPGTFTYHCTVDPKMKGAVVVQ